MIKLEARIVFEYLLQQLGDSVVLLEDLMQGLMEILPQSARNMIEKRMQEGPDEAAKLHDDLKDYKG